jgi:hypothetical protein
MIKFTDVPYRRWRRDTKSSPLVLVQTKASIRIMKIMGDEMAKGNAVEFWQSITDEKQVEGAVYDRISLTVSA